MTRPDSPMASLAKDLYQLFKNEPLRAHILKLAEKAHLESLGDQPIELNGAVEVGASREPISSENALVDAPITTEERAAAWTVAFWQAYRPKYVAGKLNPLEGGAKKLVQGDPLDELAISASVLGIYAAEYLEIPTNSGRTMEEAEQEALRDWIDRWKANPSYSAVVADPETGSESVANTLTPNPTTASENAASGNETNALKACSIPRARKAYYSLLLAEAKLGRRLHPRDAWEALRNNDWSEDFVGELSEYKIPSNYGTWYRYLRYVLKLMKEREYNPRTNQ